MRKSTLSKPQPAPFTRHRYRRDPPLSFPRDVYYYVPGLHAHSTPIALPRPPQTRAASFKRLYPK